MQNPLSTIGIILLICLDGWTQDQIRSAITSENVTEVMRMGSLSTDVTFMGPHSEPGRLVLVTRQSDTVFDSGSSRFVEKATLTPLVFDESTLKKKGSLERHSRLSSVSRDGRLQLWSLGASFTIKSDNVKTEILLGFEPRISGSAG